MKRSLLVCGLVWLAASSSFAQQRPLAHRVGDAFSGQVRSVRSETALFVRRDGELVEGARRLVSTSAYSPDGRRREDESYQPDGSLRQRAVYVYGDDGNLTEESYYDARGALLDKKIYNRADNEVLTFGDDGQLRQRKVTIWNASHTSMTEVLTYDGEGKLLERSVNTRDEENNTSIWTTYRHDGSISRRDVNSLNYGGAHRNEQSFYGADGALIRHRVGTSDAAATSLKASEASPEGGQRDKTSETREYDARRNLIKITNSRWNEAAKKFEPFAVTYHVITYYD